MQAPLKVNFKYMLVLVRSFLLLTHWSLALDRKLSKSFIFFVFSPEAVLEDKGEEHDKPSDNRCDADELEIILHLFFEIH